MARGIHADEVNNMNEETRYKYGLHTPINVFGVEYDKMVLLVNQEDKVTFDNANESPCITVELQFEGINQKMNLPVFTVKKCGVNEESSTMIEKTSTRISIKSVKGECSSTISFGGFDFSELLAKTNEELGKTIRNTVDETIKNVSL